MKDRLEYQRQYRLKTGNKCTQKYEKTVNGFLMRKYRNMQSRVLGVQKKKIHLYKNLTILPRDEFYAWALASDKFHKLFKKWEDSKHDRKLCPTVDRINPELGYEIDNMQWLTHSENSRLTRRNKIR